HVRDGGRQPDGPGRPGRARWTSGAWRGRLRESEPSVHGPGVAADPEAPVPGECGALAADQDRLRLLARRRLAVRLHGDRVRDARSRPDLSALRLPERHARPPERLERARSRLPVPPRVRSRRAVGDEAPARRTGDLVAVAEGVLLAAAGEVRDS